MLYRIPYYYSQFACIGSACQDTCCKGWRIGIDEKSCQSYQQVPGAFGARLRRSIDWKNRMFRLKDRACTLLDDQGLCEIYKELGKDAMCRACRNYPRHQEDYGEVQERMLSLSCPEAARVILGDPAQGACMERQRPDGKDREPEGCGPEQERRIREGCGPEQKGRIPGCGGRRSHLENSQEPVCDPKMLRLLTEVRLTMVCLVKDRAIPWNQRLAMILAYAHDIQRALDRTEPGEDPGPQVERWNRRYLDEEAVSAFSEKLKPYEGRSREQRIRVCAWMRSFQRLEPVLADWGKKQGRICTALYHQESLASYGKLEQRFGQEAGALEQAWENLALYFLRTWVLGAVYDGDLYGKVKLTVVSCVVIREWCLFRYRRTGHIREEDLVAAAYRYSRQVENSDENLELLEHLLADSPLYSLSSMLTVLCGGKGKGSGDI